jgi:geranylgeranyl reductase family protein
MLAADLAVVGAGPAGTAAAITAAAAGLRVVVVDRSTFPRDKCCGDGLTTGALRRLEALGLMPGGLPSWQPVGRARVFIPEGRQAVFELPQDSTTYAATCRRFDLDAALVERARAVGVTVHEGRGVVDLRLGADDATVDLVLDDGEVLRAWYAIAADGMWSPLRKLLSAGDPGYLGDWHAIRQYLRHTGPQARDLVVWFEDDIRPGYVWSFPLPDGGANVGFGVRRRPGEATGTMKQLWESIIGRPHIASILGPDAEPEGPIKAWPIPARIGRTRLSALGGRVLFVGDAARAADCMTGEGIAQALETGELAARTVAAGGPGRPGETAASYRSTIARTMAFDDRVSELFSQVLSRPRGANAWMDVADHGVRSRRAFARWMFEDYPRAGPVTPWRWKRGMVSSPGAWAAGSAP